MVKQEYFENSFKKVKEKNKMKNFQFSFMRNIWFYFGDVIFIELIGT